MLSVIENRIGECRADGEDMSSLSAAVTATATGVVRDVLTTLYGIC